MSWLVDTLIVTGALIALVLVIRRPVARAFGPGMAYALWALPMVRLILPPLLLPAVVGPFDRAETIVVAASREGGTSLDAGLSVPWTAIATVWLIGAGVYLVWRGAGYVAMRRRLLIGARRVGTAGRVRLFETAATAAPVAFGVFDQVIALPPGFMAGPDRAARDLALAHELQHHAARDLAVNLAVQPLLALHWFNPLAWVGWRALRRDQEAACDARVLSGRDAATRERYARLISGYARSPRLALAAPMACPVLGEKSIVHRLRSLTMTEPTRGRRLTGSLMFAAAALALPATASVVRAAQNDPPIPPVPAAAPVTPSAPHTETRVMIIEHGGKDGKRDAREPKFTRTITRDGRTIVIKTDQPISDAELETRLAMIEAQMPTPPVPPVPPVPGAAPVPPAPRVIMIRRAEGAPSDHAMMEKAVFACGGAPRTIEQSSNAEGKHQIMRVLVCNDHHGPLGALESMRKARASIAANTSLSVDIRAKVLAELDREIADQAQGK